MFQRSSGLPEMNHARPVVGQHDSVLLHGAKDHLHVGRIRRDIEARLQTEPFAHPRILRAGQRRGVVARGPDEFAARLRRGEADCVLDLAALHLFVGDEPGHDRQAGGVGGGPGRGTQRVRPEIEDRTGIGVPAAADCGNAPVELVEDAVGRVDRDRVSVAGGAASPFDRRVQRDRVRPGIALIVVEECRRVFRLRPGNGDERNADRSAVPVPEPKSAWNPVLAPIVATIEAEFGEDWQRVDRRVPDVVGRQHRAAADCLLRVSAAGPDNPAMTSSDSERAARRVACALIIDDS